MRVVHLLTVDSTSNYAAQLLKQSAASTNSSPPFLVWSEEQTGGRGRRGHQWISPVGNLYLTMVLPPQADAQTQQGLLPLKAGIIVARLLQHHFGLRLTLKWPNDLLFGGRKLGGLLLETSSNGKQFGELLIGLGLNLNHRPEIKGGDYLPTSLSEILGNEVAVNELVQLFASDFLAQWHALPTASVPEAYAEFGVGPDELCFQDSADVGTDDNAGRRWGRLGILRDDGSQMMQLMGRDEPLALSNADHGWRWSHQSLGPMPLAVADIGNTAIKIAWYDDAVSSAPDRVLVHLHEENDDSLRHALTSLKKHSSCPYLTLHIVSVRPEQTKLLTHLAHECGWSAVTVRKRAVRRHCDLHAPGYLLKDLGIDRLAAIEAWLSMLTSAQRQLRDHYGIVIAAGTATTIDAVGVDGRHYGGLILPGLTLAMQSLHQVASLLPEIAAAQALTAEIAAQGLGHDTRTAMMCAAVEMTIGAINQTRKRLRDDMHLHELPHGICMTGGWGERLAPLIGASYQPHLVLNGARVLVLGGWQKSN